MELALRHAKTRLSELVTAAQRGERVVITKHGAPAVKLVRCRDKQRGGSFFERLEAYHERRGTEQASPEEAKAMIAAFHDPAFSRQVLGLEDDDQAPAVATP